MIFRYFVQILLHRPNLYWTTYRICPHCNVSQFFSSFHQTDCDLFHFFYGKITGNCGRIRDKIQISAQVRSLMVCSTGKSCSLAIHVAVFPAILLFPVIHLDETNDERKNIIWEQLEMILDLPVDVVEKLPVVSGKTSQIFP